MPFAPRGPRVYYERRGSGEPLLFITGFVITAAVLEPVRPLYERHLDVISYDNRWAGRSPAPLRPTSIVELASDAARLLDALELDSAHVFGISFGGMIAQELAIRFPERVRGLVLGGTTPGGPRALAPNLGQLGRLLARAARDVPRARPPWLEAMLFSPEFRRAEPERAHELASYFTRHIPPPWGIAAHWWASVYHDTVSRLGQVQAPTLVMHGTRDGMAPLGLAQLLVELIPDAELALVPGAGHAYPLERPEESLRLLLDWLAPRSPIAAGQPRRGLRARAEPLTRALGLPIGAARTGRSLAGFAAERLGAGGRRTPESTPPGNSSSSEPPGSVNVSVTNDEQPAAIRR